MEKTRGGMESVIGSLDPAGMQALLLTGGDCRVALAVDNKTDEAAARLAIQRSFGRAVVGAVTDAPTGLAPTPLGFSSLRLACQQRLRALVERVRATAAASEFELEDSSACKLPMSVSICRGVVEPTPDHFCQVYCVCLVEPTAVAETGDDAANDADEETCAYSATLPVSQRQLEALKSATPDDYPLKWSGFAVELKNPTATEQEQQLVKQTLQQAVGAAIHAWQTRGCDELEK
ncbi:hypothetical protein BOX15_Mlig024815g2 [Macrostomum lignano]|uniref:Uncharacterized protein n=2 Tax=Macrostomum lignano TaxID=282301 RepID=A0A267DWE6_9PLAT|nr:hypothetical protein BOX15_Mlig024815g2 [Macrostomum lignano]